MTLLYKSVDTWCLDKHTKASYILMKAVVILLLSHKKLFPLKNGIIHQIIFPKEVRLYHLVATFVLRLVDNLQAQCFLWNPYRQERNGHLVLFGIKWDVGSQRLHTYDFLSRNITCNTVQSVHSNSFCHITVKWGESKNQKYRGGSKLKSPETRQVQKRLVSSLEHLQFPKRDRTQRSKRTLLTCRTRCKCSMEPLAIR